MEPSLEPTRGPNLALLALTALALWLCFLVARPFVSALAWAMALAIATYPLHRGIARRIRRENLSSAVSTLLVLIVLLAPLGVLLPITINGEIDGVNAIRTQIESGEWKSKALSHTWLWPAWLWLEKRVDLGDAIQRLASLITALASYLLQGSLLGVLEVLVIFFLLFYFFRGSATILVTIRALLPLSIGEADRLFGVVTDTVYATIYGKLAVGVVQGFLGGLMFWWLGLTAPWFWAIIMGILSIIPVVGPSLIWLPGAIILFLDGHWIRATILVAWEL